ncbi:hypothetical protein O3P69_001278 [Scylla paramamosain]|uniref:PH domain-containing protein n=1 Tax=Scylla paramamosain TaxID=85552 RepID=A0AAW0UPL0_SCYPA
MNTCIIPVREAPGDDGGAVGGGERCVIPVVVVSGASERHGESANWRKCPTRYPWESPPPFRRHDAAAISIRGTYQEPSARIILKGSIAFTHDGAGGECEVQEVSRWLLEEPDSLETVQSVSVISPEGNNEGEESGAKGGSAALTSYLESYLPEAPPRRRRSRSQRSSDSAIYVGGDGIGAEVWGPRSTSLIITLGGGDDDGGYPFFSDEIDPEDDCVFSPGTEEEPLQPHRIGSDQEGAPLAKKRCRSACEFIKHTILGDVPPSSQQEHSSSPSSDSPGRTEPQPSVPNHDLLEKTKENEKEDESQDQTKDSEKQIVNIEFITRELPEPVTGGAPPPSPLPLVAAPSPPPRSKSPRKKHRARSSSPVRSGIPKDLPNPRRSRSCCLHDSEEALRHQEILHEGKLDPKSFLEYLVGGGGRGGKVGSLPWDYKYCPLYQSMSALQMAAEGRDYLMWCPDQEFDNAVSALDIRGLVDLVQTLQDAMAVEQQTFDSLSQQLELVSEPLQQQRLSAALCTSQTRLARLCARNMRCFRQQALKARQRDNSESRSSSPRDSGLVVSSAAPSDTEGGDARSPTHGSFKNSLAFFQRAAHLVAANTRNAAQGYRQKDSRRRSSRGSSTYSSSGSEVWSVNSEDLTAGDLAASGGVRGDLDGDLLGYVDDQGTYEQVLFINGRPQYQDDFGSGGEESIASWSAPQFHAKLRGGNSAEVADGRRQLTSVVHTSSAVAGAPPPASQPDPECLTPSRTSYTSAGDLEHLVTLPRRKPYLNFKSVSCTADLPGVGGGLSTDFDNGSLSDFKERLGVTRGSDPTTITRAQSFKEGLNYYSSDYGNSGSTYSLSRTQSFHDGLASSGDVPDGDGGGGGSGRARLQRAPSVDEILESVKYLRAKKTMVKSTPDLASAPEPVYHSAGSLLGVRYNSRASDSSLYEKVPEPDYEQIHDEVDHANIAHYENFCRGNNHYENVHLKGEAIYDSPRPTDVHLLHQYDRGHADLQYENVKYDVPVYENLDGKEPTYMNVNGKAGNVYANLDGRKSATLRPSSSASSNSRSKVTISGNSTLQGTTYDVPRAATHIYDSPQRQVRSVGASTQANEYDTPRNNRSVLPQSTQIVLKAKNDQKQKIDDIFADCDKDSLDGDREKDRAPPDIPSPDYGSEEEGEGYEDASNEYVTTELPDEGLGESDSRSYYTEDPAGLEVILEEPEEEYCSSHVSEDELRRDVDITFELKCERRSLDGSEGIGSAEGDTQSSGGSEHCVEEDCASSGIHSEDTPSPGPPVDAEKEGRQGLLHKQKREEDRTQKDRCVEVYPETVRQRQRNMMAANNKVDIKNWNSSNNNNNNDTLTSPSKSKKFLPSVKALRSQFEAGKTSIGKSETNGSVTTNGSNGQTLSRKSSSSSVASISQDVASTATITSLHSPNASVENLGSPAIPEDGPGSSEPVEPIFNQFRKVDQELRELMSKPHSTSGWDPRPLLKRLYYIPEAPKIQSQGTTYVNIEGYLEKLPSGRKKATFWNAWKRRYFMAKNGILYYYQSAQTDKPSMKMTLMGGKVECMEPNMVGVDDGKGHYVVVRCSSRQEAERWRRALETHTVEDFTSQYVQPWPMPTNPTLLRDTIIVDIGSASIRAGVLASQATLPQVFIPSVVASGREGRGQVWGMDALAPDVRASSSLTFPIRPTHKISKYSVDLSAVSSLLQKAFAELKVDPKNYHIQLSVPRVLNTNTQAELLRVLFDKFGVRSINLTHQSILALYAYNATSGIVVDVGERMDIVPVIDGYIVDGGVSRVPYGGYRILDHLRQFLYMRNISCINEVESYIIRQVLENICYCAHHYNTEKARCTKNPENFEKSVSLAEYCTKDWPYESISLDFGRFQATEGLFNPDAWGLDHPGLHKLVHKAIMECSMDIRKEMSRSIFLAGGVTQLPGLVDRLTTELDNLTPPAIRPKVHASPYRYHAAYIGACVLAESPAFTQSRISQEDWNKHGNSTLRKWSL